MNIKKTTLLTALVALTSVQSWAAAAEEVPNQKPKSLSLLAAQAVLKSGNLLTPSRGEITQSAQEYIKLAELLKKNAGDPQRVFFEVSEKGLVDVLYPLLHEYKEEINVNAKNIFGLTALILAADNGHNAVVAQLIAAEADVNVTEDWGDTALVRANFYGDSHFAIVKQLLTAGADINASDRGGHNALMLASLSGNDASVDWLITARADVNAATRGGKTALMFAAECGRYAVVAQLIAAGAELNAADQFGDTALMKAAQLGHFAIVERLIEAGADIQRLPEDLRDKIERGLAERKKMQKKLNDIYRMLSMSFETLKKEADEEVKKLIEDGFPVDPSLSPRVNQQERDMAEAIHRSIADQGNVQAGAAVEAAVLPGMDQQEGEHSDDGAGVGRWVSQDENDFKDVERPQ